MKFIFLFTILPGILISQDRIDADSFFKKALGNFEYDGVKPSFSYKAPWIEEYIFRTESRDFEPDKQEYTIRVKPSSPRKVKAQNDLASSLLNPPDIESMEIYCERVKEIHEDWLRLYIIYQQVETLKLLNVVLSDRNMIIEKKKKRLDFDFDDIISLQKEKSETEYALNKYNLEKELITKKYNESNREYEFDTFISISDVKYQIEKISLNPLKDLEDEYEKELITKEIELEKSEGKQFLDFAQIRYRGPHNDILEEKISLGVGVSILNSGNRRLKIKELELERNQIIEHQQRDYQFQSQNLENLKSKLFSDISSLEQFNQLSRKENEKLQAVGEDIRKETGFNPELLLEIEQRKLQNQLDQIKLEEEILEDYLDLIEEANILCSTDQNLLSKP